MCGEELCVSMVRGDVSWEGELHLLFKNEQQNYSETSLLRTSEIRTPL